MTDYTCKRSAIVRVSFEITASYDISTVAPTDEYMKVCGRTCKKLEELGLAFLSVM